MACDLAREAPTLAAILALADREVGSVCVSTFELAKARQELRDRTAYDAIGSGVSGPRWGQFARVICESEGGDWLSLDNSQADIKRWFRAGEACAALLSTHTAAGAGPVGEAVAWRREWQAGGYRVAEDEFTQNAELAEQWRTHPQTLAVIPLRPVDEPGEVERLTRERDAWRADHQKLYHDLYKPTAIARDTAEAALAETRERLKKVEAELRYAAMGLDRIHNSLMTNGPKQASGEMTAHFLEHARAALTGDAQEAGR